LTVSPIECYVLVGISQRIEKNLWNCATITDCNTEELVPISISQRVEKNLRKCTIITDGLVPVGISQRVKKIYGIVPQLLTGIPTDSPMIGAHPEVHACQRCGRLACLSADLSACLPMELSSAHLPTD